MEIVLILGAGLLQSPAIKAAKSEGYKVALVDRNENALCVGMADFFKAVDLKDKEGILSYARELGAYGKVVGVFTQGTDFSASVSYVAQNLSLPSHSYEASLDASVKTRMRKKFSEYGVPSPEFLEAHNFDEAKKFASTRPFPLVVKPVDNMGGRGCSMVQSEEELESALSAALSSSRSQTAIVEDYMDGREFSIDALVHNGTLTITGFADRHIKYPPYFIEVGHTMSAKLSEEERLNVIAVFASGVHALDLTEGAAKGDMKLTAKGPMIGEIAARLSGGYMSGWTFPYASNFDLTREALKIAVGRETDELLKRRVSLPFLPPKNLPIETSPFSLYEIPTPKASAERACISIPGRVKEIIGVEEARKVAGVKDIFMRAKVRDDVVFPRNNVEKCANVITCAKNEEAAIDAACEAVQKIVFRLECPNPMTDEFLKKCTPFPPSAFPSFHTDSLSGFIERGEKAATDLESMGIEISSETDWTYMGVREAAKRFDELCLEHVRLPRKEFWRSFFRGGLQGALYFAELESTKENTVNRAGF